jgi:hypothetical protein
MVMSGDKVMIAKMEMLAHFMMPSWCQSQHAKLHLQFPINLQYVMMTYFPFK